LLFFLSLSLSFPLNSFDDLFVFLCWNLEADSLSDEEYKDATVILQLLRDNLNLWTTEGEDKGPGDDDKDDDEDK
jgi:hypothetical protein